MVTVDNKKITVNFNFTEGNFKGHGTLDFAIDGTLKSYRGTIRLDDKHIGMFTSATKDVNQVEMRMFRGNVENLEAAIIAIKKVIDEAVESANE